MQLMGGLIYIYIHHIMWLLYFLEQVGTIFWSFLFFFGYFLISLTLEYEYSYSKNQSCFSEKFRKPVFGPEASIFIFPQNLQILEIHKNPTKNRWRQKITHGNSPYLKTNRLEKSLPRELTRLSGVKKNTGFISKLHVFPI